VGCLHGLARQLLFCLLTSRRLVRGLRGERGQGGGDPAALRLTAIAVAIAFAALLAS